MSGHPVFQNSPSLGVKAAPVTALHNAARLLGGRAVRKTSGHGYVVYRFPPADAQVKLPPTSKGNGSGLSEVGRELLTDLLRQFREAGIPDALLASVLSAERGVSWHWRPARVDAVLRILRERSDLVERGQWRAVLRSAEAPQAPARPVEDHEPAEAPAEPEASRWSSLTLRDAIRLGLPADEPDSTVDTLSRSFGRKIGFRSGEPFVSLLDSGDLLRYDMRIAGSKRKKERWGYRMTERGAMAIAEEASRRVAAQTEEVEAEAEVVPEREELSIPVGRVEAPPARVESSGAAPGRVSLAEAVSALSERYGVAPRFRHDAEADVLVLDVPAFLRDLEAMTR